MNELLLETRAIDDRGNQLEVRIVDASKEWGPTLRIQRAGGWYLQTLLLRDEPSTSALCLDYGARWYCVNFREVMLAVSRAIVSTPWIAQSLADMTKRY